MKIPLNITVEIDPEDWRAEFGHGVGIDVRADVRAFFLNQVQTYLADIPHSTTAPTARHTGKGA